jgi:hypothetical protein
MTTGANEGLDRAEQIFKDLVWTPAVHSSLEAYLIANGLGFFPVRQIILAVADSFTEYFYANLKMIVDTSAIEFVNDQHASMYAKASVTLSVIAHDKGIESDEYKKARDEARAALSQFTRFGSG